MYDTINDEWKHKHQKIPLPAKIAIFIYVLGWCVANQDYLIFDYLIKKIFFFMQEYMLMLQILIWKETGFIFSFIIDYQICNHNILK